EGVGRVDQRQCQRREVPEQAVATVERRGRHRGEEAEADHQRRDGVADLRRQRRARARERRHQVQARTICRRGRVEIVGGFYHETRNEPARLGIPSELRRLDERYLLAPGPGIVSISSGWSDLVPCGTSAATTGFLSTLRRSSRGGCSLR